MFAIRILRTSEVGFARGPAELACAEPEHLVFYQGGLRFDSESFGVFRIMRPEGCRDFWKFGPMVFWFYDQDEEAEFEAVNLGKVRCE